MAIDPKTVYELLEKYNYESPCKGDLTNFDKDLKFLLRTIGGRFVEQIRVDHKHKGVMVSTYVQKWELIASHTARRTFATINSRRGFPEAEIRRATGHMSGTSFEKYICYDD